MAGYGWGGGWGLQVMEKEDIIDEVEDEEELAAGDEDVVNYNARHTRHGSLEKFIIQFIHQTSVRELVIEESPTLRLVKALYEKKLEPVILAIEQGARINVQVYIILKF